MLTHNLQAMRKKFSWSQTEMAEALGGEEEGWYCQRVQRLEMNARNPEKGTRLTMEIAREICTKLGRPLSDLIPDLDNTREENELMDKIERLSEEDREYVEAFVNSILEKKKKRKR